MRADPSEQIAERTEPGPCRECGSTRSHRVLAPQPWDRGKWVCTNPKRCRQRRSEEQNRLSLADGVLTAKQEWVFTAPQLEPDHFMFEDIDTSKGPTFSVSDVARVFFARTDWWIRWAEKNGRMILDGIQVGNRRTPAGARVYTLSDIEQMAHALASTKTIDGTRLITTLMIVHAIGRSYGFLV